MANNKVVLADGTVLMDTSGVTVDAEHLVSGYTALDKRGVLITGVIDSKNSTDLTVSGATVTAPAGFYSEAASKSVATTTHPKPTASINSSTGVVTASHTQGTGYVTGGTTTGTLSLSTQAAKTVTPTEEEQTAVAAGKYTTGTVKVSAISSTYVGSDIAQKDADDLTASGATVTAPAGYYAEAASKSVATTTHPAPTASIDSSTGLVTASHTQSTGYVTGGTTKGTLSLSTQAAKTVIPAETEQTAVAAGKYTTGDVKVGAISSTYVGSDIPRRTYNDMTVNGAMIVAPAGYYANASSKSVATGSVETPATTITANPDISVSASGVVTATVSASKSITPTVSAGYVSSGTAGTVTVSGSDTLQLSTQGTKTVTPTESSQTAVAAGKYTTGAVTVKAIPSTYVGSDIPQNDSDDLTASGATVTVPAGYYAEDASKSIANASLGGSSTSYSYGSENLEITRSYPNFQPGYMASMAPVVNTMTLENKTVTPSETEQVVTPTSSGYAIRKVTVGAIPSTYVGSDIPQNDSEDLTVSGGIVTVPAGYYEEAVTADTRALWVNMGTISSLPVTKTVAGVTTDMVCAHSELGTPTAQTGNWTINTDTAGQVTVSGSINGSTTLKILLVAQNSVTGS